MRPNRKLIGLMRKDVVRGVMKTKDRVVVLINKEKFDKVFDGQIRSMFIETIEYRPIGRIVALDWRRQFTDAGAVSIYTTVQALDYGGISRQYMHNSRHNRLLHIIRHTSRDEVRSRE